MQLMRRHDPEVQEKGFAMLRPHAREYLEELIAEFRREPGRMLLPHLQAGVQFRAVSYPLSGLLRGLLVPA
jgi:lauroyl/myristoyl acyltransferase